MRMHRTLALGAVSLALILGACSPGEGSSPSAQGSQAANLPTVSIGSAGFPEAALVAEIYAQALEAKGFTVERHLELGERPAVRSAFDSGDINLAPDYLGGLASAIGADVSTDPEETHANALAALEDIDQTLLDFSPGTDADGFAVTQETADSMGLATMSDLASVANELVWGLASGCPENPVCGQALNDVYGIDINDPDFQSESLNPCSTEIAEALNNDAIQVAQVCTTQAEIASFNFVLMDDDMHMAPAQNLAPVLTQELADAGGATLADALNAVSALLTTEELTNLNLAIASQDSYADIASQWLTDNALD